VSKVPLGYKLIDEKFVVDEYQAKIVQLIYRLRELDLTEEEYTVEIDEKDINWLLNNHNVPKAETEGYVIEDYIDEIMISANQLLEKKLKELKAESEF
jgi:hypothetical protein